jgi:hypothetical protein
MIIMEYNIFTSLIRETWSRDAKVAWVGERD